MSSSTWTAAALSFEPLSGICWRLIEAQHRVSTMKLVDTNDEQAALEELIEATKPVLPTECQGLHYLLSTPFRYGAPYPHGSRFRRAGMSAGVFYASETVETAIAETTFHRLLFFAESPGTPWPANPAEFTAFSAAFAAPRAVDLTTADYADDRMLWTDPMDYAACQDLADEARAAGAGAIRYPSARHPGINVALLTCGAFTKTEPLAMQSWWIFLGPGGAQARCEAPRAGFTFGRAAFAADPRIAALAWAR